MPHRCEVFGLVEHVLRTCETPDECTFGHQETEPSVSPEPAVRSENVLYFLLSAFCFLLLAQPTWAAWHETESPYRRALQIDMDAARIAGDQLADVRFLANGKQRSDGQDIFITTAQGRRVPSRVINAGPGDLVDVSFDAVKGTRDYYVYFGSGKPADPAQQQNSGGLLLAMKQSGGEMPSNAKEMEAAYDRHTKLLGSKLITRPFLGVNPFGSGQATLTRLSGKLFAPIDGSYVFAVSGDERGALFIDGKPVVFSRFPVGDVRFQESAKLARGNHDFAFYLANGGGEYRFSVVWRRPDSDKFDVIGREFCLPYLGCIAGPLEEQGKPLTADFSASYQGEAFFSWNYSHRYRFEAQSELKSPERIQWTWDFGDGQTAAGPQVEHVYLTAGTYPVRVTAKLGGNADTQEIRLNVDRDLDRIAEPPTDALPLQARLVAGYDLAKLKPETLAWAVLLQIHAGAFDEAVRTAEQLSRMPVHPNKSVATKAFQELHDELLNRKEPEQLRNVYAATAKNSDLGAWLAEEYAKLLMYSLGDFRQALEVMTPYANGDDSAKRIYAQTLLLNGQFDKAKAVLQALPVGSAAQKTPALSGAMARTSEYYAQEKDLQAGEQALERWLMAFPADYLDGNSAVMRVRLIQGRANDVVAAKFAEAYANANSQSAYAPRLLDMASHILEKSDKPKSDALRKLLKDRYPEDPLSQK